MKETHTMAGRQVIALTLAAGWESLQSVQVDRYSEWTRHVNVGPPVNSVSRKGGQLVQDGLTLYLRAWTVQEGLGGFDIWVSKRPAPERFGRSP